MMISEQSSWSNRRFNLLDRRSMNRSSRRQFRRKCPYRGSCRITFFQSTWPLYFILGRRLGVAHWEDN